ncbi:amino acid ABC transporter substrate-binding protein [Comamonas humi]
MKLVWAGLVLAGMAVNTASAQSTGGTLDKIQASGKVVVGVLESSPPMSYATGADRRYMGYHVELCEKALARIAPQARLEYMAMTPQNTLPLVNNGTIDIACGPKTNNLARQKEVAFAVTTYVSQVRMAVRADSGISSFKQLDGRNIVASAGTTAVQLLRKFGRDHGVQLNTLLGKDQYESFLMLESGRADAFVIDDNLLAGLIAGSKAPERYRIVGEVLGSEPIAVLFRRDDPGFKKAVDGALMAMMKSGEVARIYDKWFMQPIPPTNQSLNLPMSAALQQLLREPNDKPVEAYAN